MEQIQCDVCAKKVCKEKTKKVYDQEAQDDIDVCNECHAELFEDEE